MGGRFLNSKRLKEMNKAEITKAQIKVTGKAPSETGIVRSQDLTIRMNGEILGGVRRIEFFAAAADVVLVKMELYVDEIEIDLDNVETIISARSRSAGKSNIGLREALRKRMSGKKGK